MGDEVEDEEKAEGMRGRKKKCSSQHEIKKWDTVLTWFYEVAEPERLTTKMANIFMDGRKLYVNLPRFNRNASGEHQ